MKIGFFLKYQLVAKICQAPWITIARNSEKWPIFLEKTQSDSQTLIQFVLCAWEFFSWKLFFSKNIFSFVKKKKNQKPSPPKKSTGE